MIPIIIISFNNYKYVKNMIEQIESINPEYVKNIKIMDNCSDNKDTIEYLKSLHNIEVIYRTSNEGPWISQSKNADFYRILPDKFIVTDPDLELNGRLPQNFITVLEDLSEKYKTSKIGFAIDISDFHKMHQGVYQKGLTIHDWEKQFWEKRIEKETEYDLYIAPIDTTFSLFNKKYKNNFCIRVGGVMTCKHLPYYCHNKIMTEDEEMEYYKCSQFSTMKKLYNINDKISKSICNINK
jgi:hypothetical protein